MSSTLTSREPSRRSTKTSCVDFLRDDEGDVGELPVERGKQVCRVLERSVALEDAREQARASARAAQEVHADHWVATRRFNDVGETAAAAVQ